ncbi:SHOCT domain-containing protein [Novosphingobium sp. 9U]|uniref:SHOCT domain-containing protein n=1 Tax=Novosphingobium sp. 9U TaxID=2653158 RepID=UPI0012EFCE3D|nr:SHOCT domain-containing protein [Novosphingobium sp. 9U]VWX47974.1 exported hypothetical protein [Novosphingobium sp. 9U]
MLTVFRALLGLATAGAAFAAIMFNGGIVSLDTIAHPNNDPQFADLVERGYRPPSGVVEVLERQGQAPETRHEADYGTALKWYDDRRSATEYNNSLEEEKRDLAIGWAIALGALFLISLLPWARFVRKMNASGDAAADKVAKIASQGTTALKEKLRPSPIIGRSGLSSFSVADELAKWSKLRDEGVVTAAEFEEARARLLKRTT